MTHFNSKNASRISAISLLVTSIMAPVGASALSYSNPGSAVSSGDTPFTLSCEFDNYAAVGTYSIDEKQRALPANQTFSFDGSDVQNTDGSLGGYVSGNSETRRDWRMETGAPGSAIYRFTHFKQSDVIVANIDIIDGGGFARPEIDAKAPAATKAKDKAADAIRLRDRVSAKATATEKAAYDAKTVELAAALKAATKAEEEAQAADQAARAEAGTVVPDIHSIKGNCSWSAAS